MIMSKKQKQPVTADPSFSGFCFHIGFGKQKTLWYTKTGRQTLPKTINAEVFFMKYRIGIDLGGTNIVAALLDDNYTILSKSECKTNLPRRAEPVCDDMANLARETASKANISFDDILSVGIGSPGIINQKTGVIEYSCNFNYHNVPLKELMEQRLNKKVYVENDANAAAVGEFIAGAGKGVSNMVLITLGTGVGGGVIIDNKIYTGFNYAGAELGHTVICMNGRPCNCGRNGCFEAYASATGLIKTTEEIMNQNKQSLMWELLEPGSEISGKTAFQAMKQGDAAAAEVVSLFISQLSCGIINMINIFQPQLICIGGGISNEGDNLIKPVQEYIDREDYARDSKNQCLLKTAKLGNDAGLIGAAFVDNYQKK